MLKKLLLSFIGIVSVCDFAYAQPGFTCAEAIGIGSLPYNTTDSTINYGDTVDYSWTNAGNDVFYVFTPAVNGSYSIIMDPAGGHSSIRVFTDCDNIAGSGVAGLNAFSEHMMYFPSLTLTAGVTYYIHISTNDQVQTIDYSLTIEKRNCMFPDDLYVTSVGTTTADLSWDNVVGVTDFEVMVQPLGTGLPTASGATVNGTTYTATDLDPDTYYEYWVRSDCGDGTFSFWRGPKMFHTDIVNTLCPTENQCNYVFRLIDSFGDSWNGNSVTVSQNGIDVATLTLDDYGVSSVSVIVPLCGEQPFEVFWNAGGSYPNEVKLEITNPFGQIIYVKPWEVGSQNSLLFQGVANCSAPICPAPSNLRFTDLSAGSVSVTWTELGTAALWEVLVLPIGSPAPTSADSGIETSTNPFTINNLTDGGEYQFYVRAICADDFKSDWTLPVSAIATCPPPITLHEFGGDSVNGVSWWAELASQWEVIMQPAGLPTPDASGSGIIVDSPQFIIDSSVEGTFDIYVRAICSSSASVWSAPYTIEITCAQVSDVTVTGNVLSWTSNASASEWEVRVYEGNASYPYNNNFDSYMTSANPFVIPNIVVGEDYSIYVRSICAADDSSIWSTQRPFVYNGPLATDELHNDNFVIYPNPANDIVTVSLTSADNLDRIILYDMVGKMVSKTSGLSTSEATMNLSLLSKGIYLIEVVTDKQIKVTKKLIIQ